MICHEIFAQVFEGTVQNIVPGENYPIADYVTKCTYGQEAFAVDCLQYPCRVGDKYHDGFFWHVDPDTEEETQVPYLPTEEQEIAMLKSENEELRAGNEEMFLAMAEIAGGV